jgi:preprotein translocase subunit YajC
MTTTLLSLLAAPDGQGGGMAIFLFQIVGIGAVFYFLIIRPQSQARKRHATILAGLKKGDEVTTAGGIVGKVKDVKDDQILIESGTATFIQERSRIVRVGDQVAPGQ